MTFLIIQILLTLCTGFLSIFQLRKEFRRSTAIAKIEAKISIGLILLLVALTIGVQLYTFKNNKTSQTNLQMNFDSLKNDAKNLARKNDELEHAVINEVDSASVNVVLQASQNALSASGQLKKTANDLSLLIKGTDSIPTFTIPPSTNFTTYYRNVAKMPVFNMDIKCENYDSLKNCRLDFVAGKYRINSACYAKYSSFYDFPYLYPGQIVTLAFPLINNNGKSGHLEITGRLGNKYYLQQIFWVKISDRGRAYAVRTLIMIDSKETYKVINTYTNSKDLRVNWNEFSLPNDLLLDN